MNKFKLAAIAAASLAGFCGSLHAQDSPTFKFSGFGTLGAVRASPDKADFASTQRESEGTGYSRNIDLKIDSKLGGQVDATFGKQFSAALQVLVEQDIESKMSPDVTLGFVKWAPGYGLEARVGRLPFSAYLVSDYRKVGFSQPWVRPPMEVYYLSTRTVDGGDLTWRTNIGDVALKSQLGYGKFKDKLEIAEVTAKQIVSANLTADIDALTLRISHIRMNKSTLKAAQIDQLIGAVSFGVPANALFPGSPALPANPGLAAQYQMKDRKQGYSSLGLSYDPGNWFVMSEAARIHKNGFLTESTAYYVTGAMRFGSFTPYATIGRFKHADVPVTPNPLLNGALAAFAATDYKSNSLGLRWDFAKTADFKLQYDRFKNDRGSSGPLVKIQPGFATGGSFNVISATVDFVF